MKNLKIKDSSLFTLSLEMYNCVQKKKKTYFSAGGTIISSQPRSQSISLSGLPFWEKAITAHLTLSFDQLTCIDWLLWLTFACFGQLDKYVRRSQPDWTLWDKENLSEHAINERRAKKVFSKNNATFSDNFSLNFPGAYSVKPFYCNLQSFGHNLLILPIYGQYLDLIKI